MVLQDQSGHVTADRGTSSESATLWSSPLEPLHGEGQRLVQLLYDPAGGVEGGGQRAVPAQWKVAGRGGALLEGLHAPRGEGDHQLLWR